MEGTALSIEEATLDIGIKRDPAGPAVTSIWPPTGRRSPRRRRTGPAFGMHTCRHTCASRLADHAADMDRQDDLDLYEHLNAGDYCFVFNSRQMGKSSLRVRGDAPVADRGCDLRRDRSPDPRHFATGGAVYAGSIKGLLKQVGLTDRLDFSRWWKERQAQELSAVKRFDEFDDQMLLMRSAIGS
jgi:hypothetical protein